MMKIDTIRSLYIHSIMGISLVNGSNGLFLPFFLEYMFNSIHFYIYTGHFYLVNM